MVQQIRSKHVYVITFIHLNKNGTSVLKLTKVEHNVYIDNDMDISIMII